MTDPILPTKLFAPRRNRKAIPRPALVEKFAAGLTGTLTLISAPAGFGKTTLVSEWLEGCEAAERPLLAWLSLDEDDDDPARFWGYVWAAVGPHLDDEAAAVAELIQQPEPPLRRIVLTLAQALSRLAGHLVFVLDDFHVIHDTRVMDGMALLLDYLPPQAHMVLISRADPSLPLARMRVNGELSEIRAHDLRFTAEAAATYLNQAMGLNLAPQDVLALAESTEGWIAGLQLAALSMQPMHDRGAFIASFDGRHHYILDYLTEEALASQPIEVQDFLLETAVLERFDAALCQAVTTAGHGQAMLERLEQANLFLIPLDEARCWYRYHHLFADMLVHLLQQRRPGLAETLHRRAARWFDQRGQLFEAMRHAIQGRDYDWAADRIDAGYPHLKRGQLSALRGWLAALPDEVLSQHPQLDLLRARVLLTAGEVDRVAAVLERVERDLVPARDVLLHAQAMALRAYLCRMQGRWPDAIRLSEAALAALPPHDAGWRLLALLTRALGYLFACQPAPAALAYEELAEAGRTHGDAYYVIMATGLQGTMYVAMGRLQEARRLFDASLAHAETHELRNGTSISFCLAGLGELLRERNDMASAEQLLLEGTAYGVEMLDSAVNSVIGLSRLRHSQGDPAGAGAVLEEILAVVKRAGMPPLAARIEAALAMRRALLALTRGEAGLAEAERWARGVEPREAPGYMTWTFQAEGVAVARVHLALGNFAAALEWLDRAERMAERLAQLPLLLSALVLRAQWSEARGDRPAALASLERAVALAEPEGFMRLFLDEGPALTTLLLALEPQVPPGPLRAYMSTLLAASAVSAKVPARLPAGQAGLVDPLSERELEVLALMADGLSNQAIADRLGIALNTVKKHGASIMGKLGCANRTQAVVQARTLELL